MKDEQIIKALECCATDDGDDCFQCPYGNIVYKPGNGGCVNRCRKDAIDLINLQKAEINNLKAELSAMRSMANSLKKKNAILIRNADTAFQDGLNENRDLFKKEVEPEIRAEAIKEFARELKCGVPQETGVIRCADVDNLVKEMTEGNND